MAPVVVRFRSVVVSVDRFPLLAGVNLQVEPGERLLLTGPNGAGKTSLLRCIAGLLPIAQGSAEVLGADITNDRRSVRRSVGFAGHDSMLYGDLSIEENVRFAVRAAGGETHHVEGALRQLDLDGRLRGVAVNRLSAGQVKRVSLATLVARRPRLWLLDEPHASLDIETRERLNALLSAATAEGCTVIFSSHEHDVAGQLATRSVRVNNGVVEDSHAQDPDAQDRHDPLSSLGDATIDARSGARPDDGSGARSDGPNEVPSGVA